MEYEILLDHVDRAIGMIEDLEVARKERVAAALYVARELLERANRGYVITVTSPKDLSLVFTTSGVNLIVNDRVIGVPDLLAQVREGLAPFTVLADSQSVKVEAYTPLL